MFQKNFGVSCNLNGRFFSILNVIHLYNESIYETLKVLDNYPIKTSLNCVYKHLHFVSFGTYVCIGFNMTFEIYYLILPWMTNFSLCNIKYLKNIAIT